MSFDAPKLSDYAQPVTTDLPGRSLSLVLIVICYALTISLSQSGIPFFFCELKIFIVKFCVDSDILEGPSRVSLKCPIRYCMAFFMTCTFLYYV